MKRATRALALSAAAIVLSGIAAMPASADKGGDKYPKTFTCKHCNIKMTAKSAADMKKKCWVCPCKTPASACVPAKKK